jgi:hypothetical protein
MHDGERAVMAISQFVQTFKRAIDLAVKSSQSVESVRPDATQKQVDDHEPSAYSFGSKGKLIGDN